MKSEKKGEFWISTHQIASLSVMALALTVLAFFIGIFVGRGQANSTAVVTSDSTTASAASLIGPDVENDTLTELLARVEAAAATRADTIAPATPLRFSEELVAEELVVEIPEVVEEEEVEVEVLPAAMPDPPEVESEVDRLLANAPTEGWAVQVGSNPSLDAAMLRQEELQDMGIETYVVAALVGGNTWYRIRVGPFASREDASTRKNSLLAELNQDDIIVTPVR